ncbi:MAG: DUF736 family protein, partial [Parvularculaceae bacterium]
MTINFKIAFIVNERNSDDNTAVSKLVAGKRELGAAWYAKTKGENQQEFLCVGVVDPSFAALMHAAVFAYGV